MAECREALMDMSKPLLSVGSLIRFLKAGVDSERTMKAAKLWKFGEYSMYLLKFVVI